MCLFPRDEFRVSYIELLNRTNLGLRVKKRMRQVDFFKNSPRHMSPSV